MKGNKAMKKFISAFLSVILAMTFVIGIPLDGMQAEAGIAMTSYADDTPLEKQMLPYLYSKLSDSEKSVYLKLRKASLNHERTLTIKTSMDEETIERIIDVLFYEDPLSFNVNMFSYVIYSKKVEFKISYIFNDESIQKMLKKMDAVANKVISKFDEKTSTYNKILYIHDFLIDRTEYDESLNSAHSAYGAMVQGKGVCESYARAFGYICQKAGIRTVNVVGTGSNGGGTENHMWNRVYYNKKWYDIDLTWDDPVTPIVGYKSYRYFMPGSEAFSKTHKPGLTTLTYPAATKDTSMSYYSRKKLVASDNSSGYSLMVSQIAKAAKKGQYYAEIKFQSKKALASFENYIEANNYEKLFKICEAADKKTKAKIVMPYNWDADEDSCTITVFFIVKNTSIYDYFTDLSQVSSQLIDMFDKAGVDTTKKSGSKKAA